MPRPRPERGAPVRFAAVERRANVIGLGLIGGSIALALRENGWHVTGDDIDATRVEAATAIGCVDAAGLDPDAGITFVEGGVKIAEPDEGESQCQVCGESLAADLVYCSACKTPIHRECWEYFGGCATYACGNKKFLVRSKKKAAK